MSAGVQQHMPNPRLKKLAEIGLAVAVASVLALVAVIVFGNVPRERSTASAPPLKLPSVGDAQATTARDMLMTPTNVESDETASLREWPLLPPPPVQMVTTMPKMAEQSRRRPRSVRRRRCPSSRLSRRGRPNGRASSCRAMSARRCGSCSTAPLCAARSA